MSLSVTSSSPIHVVACVTICFLSKACKIPLSSSVDLLGLFMRLRVGARVAPTLAKKAVMNVGALFHALLPCTALTPASCPPSGPAGRADDCCLVDRLTGQF